MLNDNQKKYNSILEIDQSGRQEQFQSSGGNVRFKKIVIVAVAIAVTIIVSLFFFLYESRRESHNPNNFTQQNSDVKTSKLPVEVRDDIASSSADISSGEISSEKLTFGNFYKKQNFSYQTVDASYSLPINIKSDTVNYYDFSRKVNLDQTLIGNLNTSGYAISGNIVSGEKNNFWSTYQKLVNLNVPIMITNDFLLYYYQNNIKSIYKEIEKSVFYDNLWDINLSMYNTALARYRVLSSAEDVGNNALLESARMELSFFATGLKLLEPKPDQIGNAKLIDENKFNPQEIKKYTFELPEYLKNGPIEQEIAYINKATNVHRSPIFFYDKDYARYKVPSDYKKNSKLNNFYLATEWMRTEFPLYQQSPQCPDCLLDYDDWKINIGAASFIASDLYNNLELKNKWAIIYKYISFFSGLRQDFTFLNYNESLEGIYGKGYDVERIFSKENSALPENLARLQYELSKISFSDIEGSYARDDNGKKYLGMRLLQDYFWPNDYIFNHLSGDDLKKNTVSGTKLITECYDSKHNAYRCSGFGLDIVNLLKPIERDYPYFLANTSAYSGYSDKYRDVYGQVSNFNINAWNNNIYWMTLDAAKSVLDENANTTYAKNPLWSLQKNYNTFLGAWVDIHLVGDEFVNNVDENDSSEGVLGGNICNKYNFVEQNIELVNELVSKVEMLAGITNALGVSRNTNVVDTRLKKLIDDLKKIRDIEKNEIEGRALAEEDCRFIKSFVRNYSAKEGDGNYFSINQKNILMRESNNGVKLLFVVNKDAEGNKAIVAGPIYNYQESRPK